MKKLFLTSSFSDVASKLPTFINEDLRNKSVVFIPTACFPEQVKTYMENDKKSN